MYEDVSAITKVGYNNANTASLVLTRRVLSGMEDKSGAPFLQNTELSHTGLHLP